jgi:hypothetical protein
MEKSTSNSAIKGASPKLKIIFSDEGIRLFVSILKIKLARAIEKKPYVILANKTNTRNAEIIF